MRFRTRWVRWLGAAVLTALAGIGTPVSPAHADDPGDGGWSAAPLGDGEEGGRPVFYLEGAPGAVLKDTLAVTNRGDSERRVTLRGADAYNAKDGSFAVRRAERSKETGAWLAFAGTELEIPARTRAEIPLTVTVPHNAAPGDHPGAIVVRSGAKDVGIRVHLRVTGPTLAAVGIENVRVRGDQLRYELVNRGSTALDPELAVRAAGFYGDVLRHGPRELGLELLPGQRVTLHEPWPGTSSFDSVDIRLTVTAAGGARATATAEYGAVPWGPVAAVALTGAVLAGGWWHRRRGRAADGEELADDEATLVREPMEVTS